MDLIFYREKTDPVGEEVSRKLVCLSAEEKHKKEMFGKTLGGSSFAVVQQLCCFSFTPTVS